MTRAHSPPFRAATISVMAATLPHLHDRYRGWTISLNYISISVSLFDAFSSRCRRRRRRRLLAPLFFTHVCVCRCIIVVFGAGDIAAETIVGREGTGTTGDTDSIAMFRRRYLCSHFNGLKHGYYGMQRCCGHYKTICTLTECCSHAGHCYWILKI